MYKRFIFSTLILGTYTVYSTESKPECKLMNAIKMDEKNEFFSLLQDGAQINSIASDGSTALHCAVTSKSFFYANHLLLNGAHPDGNTETFDDTPLHYAALGNHNKIAQLLVLYGASLNAQNSNNDTPLHFAAFKGNEFMCRYLLLCGAHHDLQNKAGQTPMALAMQAGHDKVFELIFEHAKKSTS